MSDVTTATGRTQGLHPAVRAIVLEALTRGVGENLSTNVEFKDRDNVGAGTMQRALDLLRDRGAVSVVSRGHLGRRIEQLDIGQSWQAAGLLPVRLLLPPSGPVEIDVLAQVLADELTRLGVPHTVHHLRGGAGRLTALRSGAHDLAVVSAGTWSDAQPTFSSGDAEVTRMLSPGTYYAPRRLVVVTRSGAAPDSIRKVAIDRASADHVALTEGEFPQAEGFEYVQAPFPAVPAWVLRNKVDAGIWHVMRSVIPLDLAGIDMVDFGRSEPGRVRDALSGAALIGSSTRPELRSVIPALRLHHLESMQQAALELDDESQRPTTPCPESRPESSRPS